MGRSDNILKNKYAVSCMCVQYKRYVRSQYAMHISNLVMRVLNRKSEKMRDEAMFRVFNWQKVRSMALHPNRAVVG